MTDFAFRFYGVSPREWTYGYPVYSVTFAAEPAGRAGLEADFGAAMRASDSGVEVAMAWQWDGRSALITFDERVPDAKALFTDVRAALLAMHGVAPLEEVIFLNAECASDDPWE